MGLEGIYGRYRLAPLLAVAAMLFGAALLGALATPTRFTTLLSLVSALFIYLVVPGYILLLNVELDDLERVVLSTAVGISLIPLLLFNLNLFWFRISKLNVIIVILAVIAAGILLREKDSLRKLIPRKAPAPKRDAPKDITLTKENVVKE
jgi:uncharacterized membrane protein